MCVCVTFQHSKFSCKIYMWCVCRYNPVHLNVKTILFFGAVGKHGWWWVFIMVVVVRLCRFLTHFNFSPEDLACEWRKTLVKVLKERTHPFYVTPIKKHHGYMAVYKLTDVTLFLNLERQKREGTEGFLNGIGCMERERGVEKRME